MAKIPNSIREHNGKALNAIDKSYVRLGVRREEKMMMMAMITITMILMIKEEEENHDLCH